MQRSISLSGAVLALLCVALILVALPAGAQDGGGIPPGTAANGVNTENNSSPPNVILVAANDCTVSPGASITLEDGDGTRAIFTDQERGITITAPGGHPRIEGPVGDFIGDHARFPDTDTSFDTDGDYSVVSSTDVTCKGGGGTAADDQYGSDSGGDVDNRKGVMPGTGAKKIPNTGGPPYLALAAVALLSVAVIAGRRILRP